jgi:hypothetical protein
MYDYLENILLSSIQKSVPQNKKQLYHSLRILLRVLLELSKKYQNPEKILENTELTENNEF